MFNADSSAVFTYFVVNEQLAKQRLGAMFGESIAAQINGSLTLRVCVPLQQCCSAG